MWSLFREFLIRLEVVGWRGVAVTVSESGEDKTKNEYLFVLKSMYAAYTERNGMMTCENSCRES